MNIGFLFVLPFIFANVKSNLLPIVISDVVHSWNAPSYIISMFCRSLSMLLFVNKNKTRKYKTLNKFPIAGDEVKLYSSLRTPLVTKIDMIKSFKLYDSLRFNYDEQHAVFLIDLQCPDATKFLKAVSIFYIRALSATLFAWN